MRRRVLRAVIAIYPRGWRQRYGDELEAMVDEIRERGGIPFVVVLADLAVAGLAEAVRCSARHLALAGAVLAVFGGGSLAYESLGERSGGAAQRGLASTQPDCHTTSNVATARQRADEPMLQPRKTIVCGVAVAGVVVPAGVVRADGGSVPQSPSVASTLSRQVASTPGIVSYLQSGTAKTVEYNATTHQTVWVATGNATWNGRSWSEPVGATTIAGSYQPIQAANPTPTS